MSIAICPLVTYDVSHSVNGRQKKATRPDTKSQGVYPLTHDSKISIYDLLSAVKRGQGNGSVVPFVISTRAYEGVCRGFSGNKSRRSLVYHPQLVAVYHQHEVLHLIKPQEELYTALP